MSFPRMNIVGRVSFRALLAGSLALAGMRLAAPVYAQQEDEGFDLTERLNTLEIPVEPPLIKAQIVSEISRAIGLDEGSTELVRALHQGYVDQFTSAATQHRDKLKALMEQMRDSGGWGGGASMEDMQRIGIAMQETQQEWMKRRRQVGNEFFENVKAVLSPDQLAKWPAFERDRRRDAQLHVGAFYAGEAVDVIELISDLNLEPAQVAAIQPLIDSYAIELDGLLQQRVRAADEARDIDFSDPAAQFSMFDKYERVLTVRRQIRDVNRKHAQIIATSIPGPASEALTRRFREESYPQIYRPTEADAFLEGVLEMEDLSDGQRRGVESVAMIYRDQVATANRQLADLLADHENGIEDELKNGSPMILAMVGGMSAYADEGVGQEQMPFDVKDLLMDEEQIGRQEDLYRQRREYVVAAIEQAWSVLNPTQQARLTKPEVPEESEERRALRQVRTMMRQSMQMAEEAAREAGGEPVW